MWGGGGWGGGVRGQLPVGGIRASQGTFSSFNMYSNLAMCIFLLYGFVTHLLVQCIF